MWLAPLSQWNEEEEEEAKPRGNVWLPSGSAPLSQTEAIPCPFLGNFRFLLYFTYN